MHRPRDVVAFRRKAVMFLKLGDSSYSNSPSALFVVPRPSTDLRTVGELCQGRALINDLRTFAGFCSFSRLKLQYSYGT